MHRDHRSRNGACVRATWVKVSPDQIDRGIDFYKMTILPALEELEGFCSGSLLVDRASGRGVALATFDSVEAMERRCQLGGAQRDRGVQGLGGLGVGGMGQAAAVGPVTSFQTANRRVISVR